jgi:hypothetical protein
MRNIDWRRDEGSVSLVELVEQMHQLPYGRTEERTVESMLTQGRGTCSTKHLYLYEALRRRFPTLEPRLVHRVYLVLPDAARAQFGDGAAAAVPAAGLTDVHRYLLITLDGCEVQIDVTFPSDEWDGHSSMPLACGEGRDFLCGEDPASEKSSLERRFCDPVVREPFIAALSGATQRTDRLGL